MIEKGSFVKVLPGPYYYGINERQYSIAASCGPVRVESVGGSLSSACLHFPEWLDNSKLLSCLIWPIDRLEECEAEPEEPVVIPDGETIFDMIGM